MAFRSGLKFILNPVNRTDSPKLLAVFFRLTRMGGRGWFSYRPQNDF